MPTVLIAGGSGFLGQFLVNRFSQRDGWNVVYTYNTSTKPPFIFDPTAAFKVDFITGEGLETCLSYFEDGSRHLDAVINCVAISQPAVCEKEPEKARAVNIPTKLLQALNAKYQNKQDSTAAENSRTPVFIHLSTDQVYEGNASFSKEETDAPNPINEYGRSKLAAEQYIQSQWPNHVILRSSLIYGKEPPAASVGRPLFIQFVDEKLASGQPTSFFSDEWRSAVYVEDIIRVCTLIIEGITVLDTQKPGSESVELTGVFNMGGPERLSRVDIAKIVAEVRGYDATSTILEVPSASVPRGVDSPSDISMDVSKLTHNMNQLTVLLDRGVEEFRFTKFRDALHEIF